MGHVDPWITPSPDHAESLTPYASTECDGPFPLPSEWIMTIGTVVPASLARLSARVTQRAVDLHRPVEARQNRWTPAWTFGLWFRGLSQSLAPFLLPHSSAWSDEEGSTSVRF